ncbi:MAG: hypothetical protein IID38_01830 [Planctomycetes bacterium]|nr:hypothetical protein [Planctomycetota bacterium]
MLDCCPRCRYSFVGLSTHLSCPGCGLEIERDAQLFEPLRQPWKLAAALNGLGAAILGVAAVIGPKEKQWNLGMSAAGVLSCALALWWHAARLGNAILVSQRTIRILGRTTEPEVYDISDVGQAKWSFVNGAVTIQRTDGTLLTVIRVGFFRSNRIARGLAATIQAHVDRVQQEAQQDAACDDRPDAS